MDRNQYKVVGVAPIVIAGIICATIAAVQHLDGGVITAIGTTAVVSGAFSAWFITGIATALAFPAIGIVGIVGELIAASANVPGSTVNGIGTAACVAIGIIGWLLGDD